MEPNKTLIDEAHEIMEIGRDLRYYDRGLSGYDCNVKLHSLWVDREEIIDKLGVGAIVKKRLLERCNDEWYNDQFDWWLEQERAYLSRDWVNNEFYDEETHPLEYKNVSLIDPDKCFFEGRSGGHFTFELIGDTPGNLAASALSTIWRDCCLSIAGSTDEDDQTGLSTLESARETLSAVKWIINEVEEMAKRLDFTDELTYQVGQVLERR